jgi:hypothetical protein
MERGRLAGAGDARAVRGFVPALLSIEAEVSRLSCCEGGGKRCDWKRGVLWVGRGLLELESADGRAKGGASFAVVEGRGLGADVGEVSLME